MVAADDAGLCVPVVPDSHKQRFLVAEVADHRRGDDANVLRDLPQGTAVISVLPEDAGSGLDYPPPPLNPFRVRTRAAILRVVPLSRGLREEVQ